MSILEAPSETHLAARQAEGSQNAQCDGAQFENQATEVGRGRYLEVWWGTIDGSEIRRSPVEVGSLSMFIPVEVGSLSMFIISHYFTEFYIYIPAGCLGFLNHQQSVWFHIFLKGTNISPSKALWKMIFPFT